MQHISEGGGLVRNVSIDRAVRIELRMVEDIEHLQAKLKGTAFFEVGLIRLEDIFQGTLHPNSAIDLGLLDDQRDGLALL